MKKLTAYFLLLATFLISAMNEDEVFKNHLKNKRDGLIRLHEELIAPYTESNVEAFKQKKLAKTIARAKSDADCDAIFGSALGLFGAGLMVTPWLADSETPTKMISACFGGISLATSCTLFYNWWNYKLPTMTDVTKKVQARLTKPYDGKRIAAKMLGKNMYSQSQAAQNPHQK